MKFTISCLLTLHILYTKNLVKIGLIFLFKEEMLTDDACTTWIRWPLNHILNYRAAPGWQTKQYYSRAREVSTDLFCARSVAMVTCVMLMDVEHQVKLSFSFWLFTFFCWLLWNNLKNNLVGFSSCCETFSVMMVYISGFLKYLESLNTSK